MKLSIPELSLVVLIGASGAGKSSFARKHFKPTEVLSSDFCRGLVSDDENSLSATKDAFEVLHYIAAKRLAAGLLTVVDATNVQSEARAPLLALARQYHCLPVAIVLNVPEAVCHERNSSRPDRDFGPHVVRQHTQQLRRSLRGLKREGFRHVYVLSPEEIDAAVIECQPLWNNKKDEHGPFDIIGDVHGCSDELETLLRVLEYAPDEAGVWRHAQGQKAIFVGDLVDRGPRVVDVLKIVMDMVQAGSALCVPGNHDVKLLRHLNGKNVKLAHGLAETLAQMEAQPDAFKTRVKKFIDGLVSHYVFDDGKLVVAHAGLKEELQGRGSGTVRAFALFGETTGETDEFGLPVRYNWAAEYRGRATVVYGHTPVPEPEWLNGTINIDTGCVFGGKLTALRYPEMEILSVPAAQIYAEPSRPFLSTPSTLSAQQQNDDMLDMADVSGKRIIETRLQRTITVREENSVAALEVMSRFAADPKWLIYLPPTMSPSETSRQVGLLEHPAEAFAYYSAQDVSRVVCEEKHMGSRAVVVVCRSADVARERFGVLGEEIGIVYTRTGRRFFNDALMEGALLERLRTAVDVSGLWDELQSDWLCLDCELMPWSAKAQELLYRQYAPVGAAATRALHEAAAALAQFAALGHDVAELQQSFAAREQMAKQYVSAYQHYCWDVNSVNDLKLAPFHLLASEGKVHIERDHIWHMETLKGICECDAELLLATPYKVVDLADEASQQTGIRWWEELTRVGGEGMVVKPLDFVTQGKRGMVQPAVKCRGPEYLRIIYGPEYSAPQNLERLRSRGLGAKRSLALREFSLGIEALERFVRREPLRRVHECVFGVLALESEPVDPRL
ncbi:MAG TPA: polynucleotide kinase-phosphatase [Abditibacteriaceae bacterium]|jgi:protein phosphatase